MSFPNSVGSGPVRSLFRVDHVDFCETKLPGRECQASNDLGGGVRYSERGGEAPGESMDDKVS